jgi:hypothetical protein
MTLPTCPKQCEAMAWGSHMPMLLMALGSTHGAVLEIGVGHFSTPHLHYLCGGMNRRLVSVEQAKDWHDEFKITYEASFHSFRHGEYMDVLPGLAELPWSVVFIDNSPGGKARSDIFELFIDRAEYVVVHDYHLENEDAIKPLLANGSHMVSNLYQPPTLLASRNRTISFL